MYNSIGYKPSPYNCIKTYFLHCGRGSVTEYFSATCKAQGSEFYPQHSKEEKEKKNLLAFKKRKKTTSIHLSFWKYNINGLAGHIAARNLKKHNVRVKCT